MNNSYARYNAPTVAFAGALMLFYSWYSGSWTHPDFATHLFDWMLLIGGGAMMVVAVICFIGVRIGLLLETIVSGICGLIMLVCSGTWMAKGLLGLNTLLILMFGFMFISAARSAFRLFSASKSRVPAHAAQVARPAEPVAPHPASVASSALPKDGEPAPEEGYLAALSKENDES